MKKIIFMAAMAAAVAMASCSSKDKAADQAEATGQEAVEQTTPQAAPVTGPDADGFYTTASGLKYKVLRDAEGQKPGATDVVTVHYEGRLPSGEVFDSSYDRGEPTQFPLNMVIPGWTEGLQLMPVGSKYQFYIPSNLGYGSRGAGGVIGPDQDLIFDVELISIP